MIAAGCLFLSSSVIIAGDEAKKESKKEAAAPAAAAPKAEKSAETVPAEKKAEAKKEAAAPAPKAEKNAETAPAEKKAEAKKETAAPKAAPAAKAEKSAAPAKSTGLKIKQGVVCSSVENRRVPVGVSDKFPKDIKELFFFTHVTGAADTVKIEHRWFHNGNRVQTTVLPIRSAYFRTFSKRTFVASVENAGKWKVEAVEQATGKALSTVEFTIE